MLVVLGVSHHDLELAELNRISSRADALQAALVRLACGPDAPVAGAVLLATCNRFEIYLDTNRFHDAVDGVTAAVAAATRLPPDLVAATLGVTVGTPVAAHLFAVAAGLDAMVVGETEIAGQVAAALRRAHQAGIAGSTLNLLFQSASHAAKQVTGRTQLGAAGRSVASVALDIAEQRTHPLAGAQALVIGTGAYARVTLAALADRGCTAAQVYSPSGRAATFAERHGITAVPPNGLTEALTQADIVVTCSGTGPVLINTDMLKPLIKTRTRKLVIIDLALRPDVAADVAQLPGVTVIDLHTVADNTGPEHADTVDQARAIVAHESAQFEQTMTERQLDPAVIALRRHVLIATSREMHRLRAKYPDEIADDVQLALHRITQSLLHKPTMRARELARTGDPDDYLHALHTLFDIDVTASDNTTPQQH